MKLIMRIPSGIEKGYSERTQTCRRNSWCVTLLIRLKTNLRTACTLALNHIAAVLIVPREYLHYMTKDVVELLGGHNSPASSRQL